MKKKISLLICMLAAVFIFTGCSGSKSSLDYDKDNVEQITEFLVNYCSNADEATMEQWRSMSDFAVEQQLTEAGLPFTPESFRGALEAWQAGVDECGAYIEHGGYTYDASGSELKVTADAKYEKRDASLEFVFDENMYLDNMTVSAKFTTGEILKKAGMNTLLGMGTVFVVLIFISLIISLFKYIPAIQNAFTKKKPEAAAGNTGMPEVPAQEDASVQPGDEVDDTELIAVISAAIATAEGTSEDGFVVRSIRRRKSNRWC